MLKIDRKQWAARLLLENFCPFYYCMHEGWVLLSLAEVEVHPFIGSAFKLSYNLMAWWYFKKKKIKSFLKADGKFPPSFLLQVTWRHFQSYKEILYIAITAA